MAIIFMFISIRWRSSISLLGFVVSICNFGKLFCVSPFSVHFFSKQFRSNWKCYSIIMGIELTWKSMANILSLEAIERKRGFQSKQTNKSKPIAADFIQIEIKWSVCLTPNLFGCCRWMYTLIVFFFFFQRWNRQFSNLPAFMYIDEGL